jgi:hypothetical protein
MPSGWMTCSCLHVLILDDMYMLNHGKMDIRKLYKYALCVNFHFFS